MGEHVNIQGLATGLSAVVNQRTASDQDRAEPEQVAFADCWISPAARAAAQAVLESGWVTTGREVVEFESEFADFVGVEHAVAVQSCTAALELSLRSLRLRRGSKVLVSCMTFCGAVHAIVHAGLRPVLVDVDPTTGMPTTTSTYEAAISCGGASAMIVTHLAGDPTDVEAMASAADLPLDRVIEDAAHALGTDIEGRRVGSTSGATCFSFYATKNLPIGEGGMITTRDPGRAEWVRRARLHGMSTDAWRRYLPGGSWRYDVLEVGLKANMTDLQAAIGRAQLSYFEDWQRRREKLVALYDEGLSGLFGLRLPHRSHRPGDRHAWHLYCVRIGREFPIARDEVARRLAEQGISTSVHFIPIHHLSYFRRVAEIPAAGLPGADAVFPELLSLPLYPRLTDHNVGRVTRVFRELTHATSKELL